MSIYRQDIKSQIKTKLWVLAGGRCEYPGCSKILWRDEVTLQELNSSCIAHIEAVGEKGPRHNPELSPTEVNAFSNLMLLCGTHHTLIDNKNKKGVDPENHHPTHLLKKYKKEHEERIEFMTSLTASRVSYPLVLRCNIERYKIHIDLDDIREAMLPDRRPKNPQYIEIDLTKMSINEDDSSFWTINQNEIKRQVTSRLEQGPDGEEINHLSIFALGPIPLLIYFGKVLGDIVDVNLYQKHRRGGWNWQEELDSDFEYLQDFPEKIESSCEEAIIELSISGNIRDRQIPNAIRDLPRFRFVADNPSVNFLNTFEKLELFKKEIREFLKVIREENSNIKRIHLIAAIPCPLAIEFGRAYMPKIDQEIIVYNSTKEKFEKALTLN